MHTEDFHSSRIVIDGLNLDLREGTGIATYGANLARLLDRLHFGVDVLYDRRLSRGHDPLARELAFHDDGDASSRSRRPLRLRDLVAALPWSVSAVRGLRAESVAQELVLLRDSLPNHPSGAGILSIADVFRKASAFAKLFDRPLRVRLLAGSALHLTYAIPLKAVNAPTIMTVHDVIPLRLPRVAIDPTSRFLRNLRIAAAAADHIIAVSESAKEDLLRALDLRPEKITVTYQPIRPIEAFDPDAAAEIVERLYGLAPGEYFLFVGAIEPKKNLPRLIEAYLMSGTRRPLVIAGPDGWFVDEQLAPLARYTARPKNAGEPEKIRRLGYLAPHRVAALLTHTRALLFPSLYEGFGLPVLEAMQFGAPVLAGSMGALPEIAGDAALLVDPFDVAAIARGIRALDADTDLVTELRARGLANVARFSDAACLERLEQAYHAAGIATPTQSEPRG